MSRFCCWIALLAAVPAGMADVHIVVDHSMDRSGGAGSDTLGGYEWWQLVADDIMLGSDATIRHITWWGFYIGDAFPDNETMRIRFYNARPTDGLPGDVLFEQNVTHHSRTPTGVIIPNIPSGTSLTAAEQVFESNLLEPVTLQAGVPYWLEIAQVGDSSTWFGWRRSDAEGTGIAHANPNTPNWVTYGQGPDMAFQLSTIPEPGTLILMGFLASLLARRSAPTRR